MNIKGVNFGV